MSFVNSLIGNMMAVASVPPSPSDTPDDEWSEHVELRNLINQIRDLQRDVVKHTTATGTGDYEDFMDWLKQCRVKADNVELKTYDGMGQGVAVTTDVRQKDKVMSISESCMLSEESAERSNLGEYIADDKMLKLMPNVTLALHLLLEMADEDSFWQPYIAVLPSDYPIPLFWELHEVLALKGSPAFTEALRLYKHVCRQYGYIHNKLSEAGVPDRLGVSPETFTFDDYRWAVGTVMTRQNKIPIKQSDGSVKWSLALIPLWDMMNHDNHMVSTNYDTDNEALEFYAPTDFKSGQQLTMFYGDRPNAEFLVHQGFYFDHHKNDYMSVPFALDEADNLFKVKSLLCRNLTIPPAGDFVLSQEASLDPQLQAFLRINAMSKDEVEHHLRTPADCASLGSDQGVVSRNNEFKALMHLSTKVKTLLKEYPSIEDFPEATSEAIENACKLLKSESAILTHTISLIDARMQALKSPN